MSKQQKVVHSVEEIASQLAEKLRKEPMTSTVARAYAEREYGRSKGTKAYAAVLESAEEYDLEVAKTGRGNEKIIRAKSA